MDITLLVLLMAGMITGFSKFSVGGMGLLILPVIMIALPGPEALGVIAPMYVITHLMAVSTYRKQIAWRILLRFLPITVLGVGLGGWLLSGINPDQFQLMLGVLVVLMLSYSIFTDHYPSNFMRHPAAIYIAGLLSGVVSIMANAAGPIVSLFFMEQKLPKEAYMSTRAWCILLINLAKFPPLIMLGLMNKDTILFSIYCIPGMVIGAFMGYWLVKKLDLNQFKWLIRGMSAIAAIKLFMFS